MSIEPTGASEVRRPPGDTPAWVASYPNPYLEGVFAPLAAEREWTPVEASGEIPRDLSGVVVRNGPNPVFAPRGRYHWFDGDGMLHAVRLEDGRAWYSSRWVRTLGYEREQSEGRALWPGYLEAPDRSAPPGSGSDSWLKDTANTDVVFHNGHALALWYQCGLPYRVDPRSLETLGPERFGGALPRRVSAHAKVDPQTGELLFFDYSTREPYLSYHVASATGELVHSLPIDVPSPRLPHDMAITEHYSILMDLPLFWNADLLARGAHKLEFHADLPSRFAIVPRRGGAAQVRWFEAEPTYIYHVINAWEEGEEIVMDACRVLDPLPRGRPGDGPLARMLAVLKIEARLCRWRFDLRTGTTREERLDDRNAEFPSIDRRRLGRRSRHAYLMRIAAEEPTLLFDGIVKHDTATGRTQELAFGPGRFGHEAPFAPRVGARDEDDGYLLPFVNDARTDTAELWILDARDLAAGPRARLRLPHRIPTGFHTCWVPADQLPPRPA